MDARVYSALPAGRGPRATGGALDVQIGLRRSLHDELEAGFYVLAHQLGQHAVGLEPVGDCDAEEAPRRRIQRGPLQLLRLHLAEALEAHDLGPGVPGQLADDAVPIRLV